MKLDTLAEIYQNALNQESQQRPDLSGHPAWSALYEGDRQMSIRAMKQVIEHLATVGGPTVEEAYDLYVETPGESRTGIAAVFTAVSAPLQAKIAVLEAKLEKVKALPDKWRNRVVEPLSAYQKLENDALVAELMDALSTPALQPEMPAGKYHISKEWLASRAHLEDGLSVEAGLPAFDVPEIPQNHQPPAEQAESEPKKPQSSTFEQDGQIWHSHKPGDPCPVDAKTAVKAIYEDGRELWPEVLAERLDWSDRQSVSTGQRIKGYRLVKPHPDGLIVAQARIKELEAQFASARQQIEKFDAEIDRQSSIIDTCRADSSALAKSLTLSRGRLAAAEQKLALLTPRPVSVRPTKEDGDLHGKVVVFTNNGAVSSQEIKNVPHLPKAWTHWLPGNLAKLCPELLPKPEDKERAEFDRWYNEIDPRTPQNPFEREATWKAWQARAGKEAK